MKKTKGKHVFEGENAIALFDILGFRDLVKATTPSDFRTLLDEVVSLSKMALFDAGMVGSMVLSDTILLYGRASEIEANMFAVMVSASNLLNAAARHAFPIRGALSRGPLLVEEKETRCVGLPVVKAYELEKGQEWMGAIVDPEFEDQFSGVVGGSVVSDCAVRYRAPMKIGPRVEYLCIGWTSRLAGDRRILENAFPGAEESHDAWRKRENTLAFFDFCHRFAGPS